MSQHTACVHFRAFCNCHECWLYSAQCPTSDLCAQHIYQQILDGVLFNIKDEWEEEEERPENLLLELQNQHPTGPPRVSVIRHTNDTNTDQPDYTKNILASFHHPDRENHTSTSPEILPLQNDGNADIPNSPIHVLGLHQRQPSTDLGSRTPINPNITSSTIRSPQLSPTDTNIHPLSHEHVIQNTQAENILESDGCASNKTHDNDDPGRERQTTSNRIRHAIRRRCDISPSDVKRAKTSPTKRTTNVNTGHPGPSTLTSLSTPPSSDTSSFVGSDHHDGSDSSNNSSSYTFIPHRRTFDALPPTTRRSPSFAAFDHGDHIHIIFTVNHSNNSSRHLTTILKFLKVNFEGIAEAHSSLQLIRYITRFISYLIRKGLGTFYKYGSRVIPILKPLTDALLHYDTTDQPSTSHLACEQYVEQKKQASKETVTQRTFSNDYISSLITENKITSYESFQRTLPTETKIQLLKQLGYVGQNIIKTLIKIHTIEALQTIKTKHYYQLIADSFDLSLVQHPNVTWLTRLFASNAIPIEEFFAKFLIIHSTNITKINTFVIQGPTNTGKSLILNLLLSDTKPTRIARERDKSNFHLDQLPNSTAVLFEEPIIDQTTIGTWKLLLEGSPIPTDMKHSDKEIIYRLPVFISTNQPIWNWVSADDVSPLKQRLFQYDITTQISSFVDRTGTIPQPPSIITKHDLYALFLHHLQHIHDEYISLLASLPISETSKPYSNAQFDKLQQLQIQLLLQDSPDVVSRAGEIKDA
ncbi:hypothetical protein B7P43_CG14073 [Cryptotermes secundus]|uniref:SF3 helicase domain-containing protein n=1 Tax=Cryptotermes secundus TaxID=105785 RepID=A0A2J7RSB0_9NEOP|nr:uncharacterized protein LOC117282024 [Cryptotermes secundus]PNF43723.1 hypothetical protein B7P43_CG14073 [Cryptotermes secundus]